MTFILSDFCFFRFQLEKFEKNIKFISNQKILRHQNKLKKRKKYMLHTHLLESEQKDKFDQIPYKTVNIDRILFKSYLSKKWNDQSEPIPDSIRKMRNNAIWLSLIEIACCVLSFGLYFIYENLLVLTFCIFNLIFVLFGTYSKLVLSRTGLFVCS